MSMSERAVSASRLEKCEIEIKENYGVMSEKRRKERNQEKRKETSSADPPRWHFD
jgi:hypothetical protein